MTDAAERLRGLPAEARIAAAAALDEISRPLTVREVDVAFARAGIPRSQRRPAMAAGNPGDHGRVRADRAGAPALAHPFSSSGSPRRSSSTKEKNMRSFRSSLRGGGGVMPRAIVGGRVRAESEVVGQFRQLNTAFADFRTRNDARLDTIEAHVNAEALRGATAATLGGGGGLPVDPDYTRTFASYFRQGVETDALRTANSSGERHQIQAAMSVGSNSDGGYIAPTEWDRQIRQAQIATSPMRQIAQVQATSVGAFSTVWNNNQWGSGWVGETAPRPNTATPALATLIFAAGEVYASPTVTQRLLDDSAIDFQAWLGNQVEVEFNRQEGIAFAAGDGVNKPMGYLQYVPGGAADGKHPGGNLDVVASGSANDLGTADTLVKFAYGLLAPYRQNATWTMNSATAAIIATMKDATGRYIWQEGILKGAPPTLLGRPVAIDENMPNVGAGATPIAFGDFNAGYLINDRIGVRVLRDPYTTKGFVTFYTTKRVGAGVLDPRAIRLLKVAAA